MSSICLKSYFDCCATYKDTIESIKEDGYTRVRKKNSGDYLRLVGIRPVWDITGYLVLGVEAICQVIDGTGYFIQSDFDELVSLSSINFQQLDHIAGEDAYMSISTDFFEAETIQVYRPHKCPLCSEPALIMFMTVECSNYSCKNFAGPE